VPVVQVDCKLFGPFRDDAGVEDVGGEYDPDTTVGELLRSLESEYPSLDGRLVDEEAGETAGSTVVTVDEKNVTHLHGLDTELEDGDVVRIVPSVYGG
jgi:molybdopterin synthase sulfur carrier subunit